MRILGIDPGLTTAGLGVVEYDARGGITSVDWLSIEIPSTLPLSQRLAELSNDLEAFLDEYPPDVAVVEQLFFATNKRTAMDVAHARGVILLALERRKIQIIEVTPLAMKLAITGDGKADKKQVQAMVRRILQLQEIPKPADAADALALAIYGSHHRCQAGM